MSEQKPESDLKMVMSEIVPTTIINKPTESPVYLAGSTDRPEDDRTVAVLIGVRCEFRMTDRVWSDSATIHRLPILRKFYEMQGGSVSVVQGWPVKLERMRPLNPAKLLGEIESISNTYRIPTENGGVVDCVSPFLGSTPDERLTNLRNQMEKQLRQWVRLTKLAVARLPEDTAKLRPEVRLSMAYELLTTKEIEDLIALGDPSKQSMQEILLSEIQVPNLEQEANGTAAKSDADIDAAIQKAKADAAKAVQAADESDQAMDRLTAAGFDQGKAMQLASLIDLFEGGAKIPDSEIKRIVNDQTLVAKARLALQG